jgi:hypothetical protein
LQPARDFQANLAFGKIAETQISRYLKSRGNLILPVYDIEYETGKGPRLFGIQELIAPDMLCFGAKHIFWVEAKRKTVFSWHRITKRWTTGINKEHWEHYIQVHDATNLPVWLFFLHTCSTPSPQDLRMGCPDSCPVGLFGNTLAHLKDHINHTSSLWGNTGMVYWAVDHLKLIAPLCRVE